MSGISFDLEKPHLPKSRHHYPKAPFAHLWTQAPGDADRAYELYTRPMGRTWDYQNPFYEVWGGRPFNVSSLLSTVQYQNQWANCAWPNDERTSLAYSVSRLSATEIQMLRAIAGSNGPVAVSRAVYRLDAPDTIADRLVGFDWVSETETKPLKKYPTPERALTYSREDAALLVWEFSRRDWLCEFMVRYQYAYEATMSDLISYRESGVVERVEVLTRECCSVCQKRFPEPVRLGKEIEIPIDGCIGPDGCNCCVTPVVELGQ